MDYIVIYLLMVLKSMNSKQKILKLMQPLLCLDNVSKDFSADNMKKKLDYIDMSMIFQLIMIILLLLIFWIFINI